jgi:hypothetical protein
VVSFNTVSARHKLKKPPDFEILFVICLGSQLLKSGDIHWERAMNGDPDDLWGNAQLAQDDYRQALACVIEKDIELEGATLAKLARFFLVVAKVPTVCVAAIPATGT